MANPNQDEVQKQYAAARRQAKTIYRGPDNIVIPDENGGHAFYGWRILALEARWGGVQDIVESHVVYANLLNALQQTAILRTTLWDSNDIRRQIAASDVPYRLTLPARFVHVPTDVVRTWVTSFEDMRVPFSTRQDHAEDTIIKRVRIEWDYATTVWERMWRLDDASLHELDRNWADVWAAMAESAEGATAVTGMDEGFFQVPLDFAYDTEAYYPALLLQQT